MLRNKNTESSALAGLMGTLPKANTGSGGVQPVDMKALRAQTRSSVLLMCLQAEMAGAPITSIDQLTGEVKTMPPINVNAASMVGKSEVALNALEGILSSDLDGDGDVAIVGRLGNSDGEVQDSSPLMGQGKDRERAVNDLATNMFESMTGVDLDNDGDVGIGA